MELAYYKCLRCTLYICWCVLIGCYVSIVANSKQVPVVFLAMVAVYQYSCNPGIIWSRRLKFSNYRPLFVEPPIKDTFNNIFLHQKEDLSMMDKMTCPNVSIIFFCSLGADEVMSCSEDSDLDVTG